MQGWKTYKLGEILKVKHGYAFKGENFITQENKNLLLTPGNFQMSGGIKFNWGKQKFYNGKYPKDYILEEGDLVIAMTDLTQSCDILGAPIKIKDSKFNYLHNQRLGLIVENRELVFKDYLFHYFNTYQYRSRLIATKSGSTVSHTAPERIYDCEINLPPLPEQKAIASILSALDDKIELNLQMNKTLEEMAMALYKHWFVDFGYFEDGKFVESDLGMIPEGWVVKRLQEIVDVCSSNRIFLKEYVDDGIPFYRGKEIIQLSKGMNISTELFIAKERYEEIKSKAGVPIKNDILISSVGTIGVSWLVEDNNPFYFKDGNLTWIRNYNSVVNGYFISMWLKSNETQEQIKSETIGSTQQALTISALRKLKVVLPPTSTSIIDDVSVKLELWHNLLLSNKNEVKTLTTLRDTLLPKLISGEVRVKDIEQMVTASL